MDLVANTKSVVSLTHTLASNATHTAVVDCLGFDTVSIDVLYRSIKANVTQAPAVVAVQHADVNAATSYANITGLVQGTDYTAAAVANTNVVNVTRFDLSTKALRRFLRVSVTPAAEANEATNVNVVVAARLGKAEQGTDTAAKAGVTLRVVK